MLGILHAIWGGYEDYLRKRISSRKARVLFQQISRELYRGDPPLPAESTIREVFSRFDRKVVPLCIEIRKVRKEVMAYLDAPPTESLRLWKVDGWEPTSSKLRRLFSLDGLYNENTGEVLKAPEMLQAVDVGTNLILRPYLYPSRLKVNDTLSFLRGHFIELGVPEQIRFDLGKENSEKRLCPIFDLLDVTMQQCPVGGVKLNSHIERVHRTLNEIASKQAGSFDLKIRHKESDDGRVRSYGSAQAFQKLYQDAAEYYNQCKNKRVKDTPRNAFVLRRGAGRRSFTEHEIIAAFHQKIATRIRGGAFEIDGLMYYHPDLLHHEKVEARVLIGDRNGRVHCYSEGRAICVVLPRVEEGGIL